MVDFWDINAYHGIASRRHRSPGVPKQLPKAAWKAILDSIFGALLFIDGYIYLRLASVSRHQSIDIPADELFSLWSV